MLQRLAGKTSDADLRAFLGSFDFRGERIDTQSKLFSGGERARLTLALIVWQRPNVLVLDEPTNHLDLEMRQALSMALQEFEGAVILVSHDREMIANVCDELYLVHDGQCNIFDNDIAYYSQWLSQTRKQQAKQASDNKKLEDKKLAHQKTDVSRETSSVINALSKEEQRKKSAEQRKLTAPIRKKIENEEKQLEKFMAQLGEIEEKLGDAGLYEDSHKATLLKLLDEQTTLKGQIEEVEENVMTLMMALEEMENNFN